MKLVMFVKEVEVIQMDCLDIAGHVMVQGRLKSDKQNGYKNTKSDKK